MHENDIEFMKKALALACKGRGFTSPNPMVGAVCVNNGEIVGEGYHEIYGGPHAEVNCLDMAGEKAKGSTLYVTLEPCNHYGKTPPCTKKILESGVKRVVVAMTDPNPSVNGGGNDFLKSKGVEVVSGLLEDESKALNLPFVKHITRKIPYVVLKLAMTLDGKIATKTGDSKWITNEKSRAWVHSLRHQSDAILVGKETVISDDPKLDTRLENGKGADPIRVILDSNLSLNPDSDLNIFKNPEKTLVVHCEDAREERVEAFSEKNIPLLSVKRNKDMRVDMEELLNKLGEKKISSLMIEGGSHVAGSALNSGIVDQIAFFYGAKIIACSDAYNAINGKGPERLSDAININRMKIREFDNNILLEARLDSKWDYEKNLIWPVFH